MREIITTMQVSLDGMAERADGGTDWIGTDPDAFDFELFDRADACVLGRAMYADYQKYWRSITADPSAPLAMTGQIPTADEIRYAEFAERTPHYVLSRRPIELDWPVATQIADLDAVRALRDETGGSIYLVGGPTTVGTMLDRGLVDELRLIVHPVILGGGNALFGRAFTEQRFDLVSSATLAGSVLRLVYRK
jgi:dihydrofolate reductase